MNAYKITPELRAQLLKKSNLRGSVAVGKDWGLIVLAFAISIQWPHPIAYVVSTMLLGSAQLGLAILMHDAAHRAVFSHEKTNDFIGEYLCALPGFNSLPGYRSYHFAHHRLAGTVDDPDLAMTKQYPISVKSLGRKLMRDVSGISGVKGLIGLLGMKFGYWQYQLNGRTDRVSYPSPPTIATYIGQFINNNGHIALAWQFAIWAVLYSMGYGWYYLLWAFAFLIPLQVFARVRQIADHAVVADMLDTNPLMHARSTRANVLEKLILFPHHEHYHLEHHLLPSAPSWNLPKLHAVLVSAGAIPEANQASGIVDVLQRATRSDAQPTQKS